MNFNPFKELSDLEHSKDYVHPAIEQAHKVAKEMLSSSAIDPHDFIELYGRENVARDLASVEKKEKGFSQNAQKIYAEVLEAILYDQIEHGEWFGPNARTVKTAQYDDFYNGSDLILELEEATRALSHLSLSIDVTFGTTTEEKKFAAIKQNIDNETLGKVKYFHSQRGGFRGELSKVPQVVIGIEKDTIIKLAGLWADEHGRRENGGATLNIHPVQRVILTEVLLELRTFRRYAEETRKESLVPIYEKDINIVEEILREKGPTNMREFRDDKVFSAIKTSLEVFKKK